jgi:cytochrome c oxidase subunit 3
LAWRLLTASGYLLAGNPANSFFYLITGLHGLHLAGGLVALGRTGEKMWRGVALAQLRPSLGLCTTYWHFLLIVWLVLLAMLTGYIGDFVTICRGFIS